MKQKHYVLSAAVLTMLFSGTGVSSAEHKDSPGTRDQARKADRGRK